MSPGRKLMAIVWLLQVKNYSYFMEIKVSEDKTI